MLLRSDKVLVPLQLAEDVAHHQETIVVIFTHEIVQAPLSQRLRRGKVSLYVLVAFGSFQIPNHHKPR